MSQSEKTFTVTIPLFVETGKRKKKKQNLSRNGWDNIHFMNRSAIKAALQDIISSSACALGRFGYLGVIGLDKSKRPKAIKEHRETMLKNIESTSALPDGKKQYQALFYADRTNQDMDNYMDVVLKIATDTLMMCGIIEDDSVKTLVKGVREFVEIDKDHPRIVVTYSLV